MKKNIFFLSIVGCLLLFLTLSTLNKSKETKNSNVFEVGAIVLETNESEIVEAGVAKFGPQHLRIKITDGQFKDEVITAVNQIVGQLSYDNYYQPGDKIFAGILVENDKIMDAKAIDLNRQVWQFVMFGVFVVCLVVFAGIIGIRALFSFVASFYIIWTVFIPNLLNGGNPLTLSLGVIALLTGIIIFSVAGFTRKAVASFLGTLFGLIITVGLTLFFGDKMGLHGLTAPFVETLIFSGHQDLNMRYIFYSAIILGASGAAMDISMDVSASMAEVKNKKPDIEMKELIQSGFTIGRTVIGTMTTTLLLAYSGGYLTLLMLFVSKDSSLIRILNLKIVSAEIMRTLIGSIGLVLVAPITAIIAGWLLSNKSSRNI